ncbi:MAG: hypothetical protein KBC50_00955 [Candidatus Pacebacteria bacterium]|jgi:hypothetical protein|nr:hypothetical protein [Candidatus Paceibacterota bacterium]
MAKAKMGINKGDHVIACPKKIKQNGVAGKLFGRTKLTEGELTGVPMEVIDVTEDQVRAKHPHLSQAVTVHAKFLVRADHPAAM